MNYLTAVGITVGLLAGIWVFTSGLLGIPSFCGFLGWATYFAIGKGKNGLLTAFSTNLSGVLWGLGSIWLMSLLPDGYWYLIVVIVAAACMCWQANLKLLSFIPGTFIGNACFYATDTGFDLLAISFVGLGLVCGVGCGLASDYAARAISTSKTETLA
ncbi:MAG: DUF1097 domain-containing protein [Propionibacteriaceae bacterium]|nr:DUF1097 domain-containing protein [Propionibacteriaceae bacterium]